MQKSNIFIISGPSGAGEDSIIDALVEKMPIERIITTTTRNKRPGEVDGKSYYFVSQEEFEKKLAAGEFAEHAKQYNGNLYGVSKTELERVQESGKIGIWKIEYKGVMTIKNMYPEIIAILINTTTLEVLEGRIRHRDNVSDEYIKERMEYTKEWLKHTNVYDYVVINENGKLNKAVEKVIDIIKSNS